jgi:hypothetical protein
MSAVAVIASAQGLIGDSLGTENWKVVALIVWLAKIISTIFQNCNRVAIPVFTCSATSVKTSAQKKESSSWHRIRVDKQRRERFRKQLRPNTTFWFAR